MPDLRKHAQYWQVCQVIKLKCGCDVRITFFMKMLANTEGVPTQIWDVAWQTMQRIDVPVHCAHML